MGTKLAKIGPQGLERRGWTDEEVALIRAACQAQDLSNDEFQTYLYVAWQRGLNPLKKEIYAIRRKGKITHQTGIDGFRVIGARTGLHAGTDDAVFAGKPGEHGFAATVVVYKIVGGVRCPFTATARWEEYCPADPKDGFMWRRMPHSQLAKCAESLALRKAFPESLGGLYTTEEMAQAGDGDVIEAEAVTIPAAPSNVVPGPISKHPEHCGCDKCMPPGDEEPPPPAEEPISAMQRKLLWANARRFKVSETEVRAMVLELYGATSTANIPRARFNELLIRIEAQAEREPAGAPA